MRRLFGKPNKKNTDVELEYFRIRLIARLCVIFIFLTQVGQRLGTLFGETKVLNRESIIIFITTLPFYIVLSLIVLVEFIFYKRIGLKVLKFSRIIDTVFFIVFMGEWMATLSGVLVRVGEIEGACFSVPSIFGITSFSWRTMLQSFVVQKWQLKIIAPTAAFIFVMAYLITVTPEGALFILIKGILQILYIIFIFYFEDKINLKLLLVNLQQEKWVKINEFILENIPEKIAILTLNGELTYMSEYFKNYIKKWGFYETHQSFFQDVTNLQQISEEVNLSLTDKTGLEKLSFANLSIDHNFERIATLEDLLSIFRAAIQKGTIEEKAFLSFNGKFGQEGLRDERSLEIKISYIKQHSKPYIVLIIRDTTQRDHFLTLESNNRYKDHLLATVSHELRTPLNGTMNLVEAATKVKEVPENVKQDLLAPALKSSQLLLHLINDILDLSQISAQKLRLVFEAKNIRETLRNAFQLLELHAKKKGLELSLNLDSMLPITFCTDHTRLTQIVLNLMNNSIKFTHEGSVKLSATPIEDSRCLKICVEDTGIGITQEDVIKLFKEYTHIECKDRSIINPAGVGLGLSIANNLAKLLGPIKSKSIVVSSILGQGSEFTFIIEDKERDFQPLKMETQFSVEENSRLSEGDAAIEPASEPRISKCFSSRIIKSLGDRNGTLTMLPCECAKILVIDDDPFNILAYESVFNTLGMRCESACSGKLAIDKLLKRIEHPCKKDCQPYRVAFVDKEMPGMDGIDTVRNIQAMQKQKKIPEMTLIGCTAHDSIDQVRGFLNSGIDQCIQKPISAELIRRVLENTYL